MTYAAPTDPARSRMTSGYGVRPGRSAGRPTFHAGLDFLGRRGDPVYVVADGVVDTIARDESTARNTSGYGNVISVYHPAEGAYTLYAHLDEILVTPGQNVPAGKLIGRVGNTTNRKFRGMGTHLHFEVRNPRPGGGAPFPGPYRRHNIDPEPWLTARGVGFDARGRYALGDGLQGFVRGSLAVDWSKEGQLQGLGQKSAQQAKQTDIDPKAAYQVIAARRPKYGYGLFGLGQATELDMDAEGLPEEPVRDPWTFDPPKPWVLIATAGALGAAVLAGATVLLRAR